MTDEIYELFDKEEIDLLLEYLNTDYGKHKKMAERMGISANALYKRIIKIKSKIKDYLKTGSKNPFG